jgi:hypothetical protein
VIDINAVEATEAATEKATGRSHLLALHWETPLKTIIHLRQNHVRQDHS